MKRPCFTLIELVIVISIIALLMAVLFPTMRSSRQQAKAALCSSNIKQLLLALFSYEADNLTLPYGFYDDFFDSISPPPFDKCPGNLAYDKPGWWWFNYISDYSRANKGKKQALWCPSRKIRRPEFDHVLHGNYGVNRSICKSFKNKHDPGGEFVGTPLSTIDIPRPGATLLIVDSGYSIISWWHATDEPPTVLTRVIIEDTAYIPGLEINKDRDLWPWQEQDAIYGRHPNKTVNVGFVDGHVSHIKADDLLIEKTKDVYKNIHPLWQPK